jgi:hypothetical protein
MYLINRNYTILFSFFLIFISCTKSSVTNQADEQFQKWKKLNISDYEFTLRVNCFCTLETAGPHNIVVKNNTIQTVNGVSYDPTKHFSVTTIDQLFVIIDDNLAKSPFSKTLEYDSKYHFPSNIYFDISQMIADEEIGYTVSQFKPR